MHWDDTQLYVLKQGIKDVATFKEHDACVKYIFLEYVTDYCSQGRRNVFKSGGAKSYWQIIKCMPILCEAHMLACRACQI